MWSGFLLLQRYWCYVILPVNGSKLPFTSKYSSESTSMSISPTARQISCRCSSYIDPFRVHQVINFKWISKFSWKWWILQVAERTGINRAAVRWIGVTWFILGIVQGGQGVVGCFNSLLLLNTFLSLSAPSPVPRLAGHDLFRYSFKSTIILSGTRDFHSSPDQQINFASMLSQGLRS